MWISMERLNVDLHQDVVVLRQPCLVVRFRFLYFSWDAAFWDSSR